MNAFKDAGHIFRLAAVFVCGILVFVGVRAVLVPKSFGQYGHYRGDALAEIAARPVNFAGHQACEDCHSDVLDKKKAGKHAHVNCEACHGAIFERLPVAEQPKPNLFQRAVALVVHPLPSDPPLLRHAEDPTVKPVLPDTAVLCASCHTASAAKPKGFPQVVPAEHSNGMPCETCHQPHSPGMATPVAAAGGAK